MASIPHQMQAVRLRSYRGGAPDLEVRAVPTPSPGAGEVLVKLSAAPVHPADLLFCRGQYGFRRALPTTPGFEGSGVVVATGGGLVGRLLRGRRVAVAVQEGGEGTWAEYVTVPVAACVPLPDAVSDEQGATMLVNPATVIGMIETIRRRGHSGMIHTAAAGTVGRMLLRYAQQEGVPVVAVVRRAAQVDVLQQLGAAVVLSSADPDFDARLRRACREYGVSAAFDAVGGALTGQLLDALPDGADVYVYGMLSGEDARAPLGGLIFNRKTVHGWWLGHYLRALGAQGLLRMLPKLRRLADGALNSEVAERVSLYGIGEALSRYEADMSRGKVLVVPGREVRPRGV